jgi:hypothetical protein
VNPGVLLSLIVTVMVGGLFALMIWETRRLWLRLVPLTGIVRYYEHEAKMRWLVLGWFVAGLTVGFLSDHFAHF